MPKIAYTFTVPNGSYGQSVVASANPRVGPQGQQLWVHADAYQGDEQVYSQGVKFIDGEAGLQYGPTPSWGGGAARGEAQLGYWDRNLRFHVVESVEFEVNA